MRYWVSLSLSSLLVGATVSPMPTPSVLMQTTRGGELRTQREHLGDLDNRLEQKQRTCKLLEGLAGRSPERTLIAFTRGY